MTTVGEASIARGKTISERSRTRDWQASPDGRNYELQHGINFSQGLLPGMEDMEHQRLQSWQREGKRQQRAEDMGVDPSPPVLSFHTTSDPNFKPIADARAHDRADQLSEHEDRHLFSTGNPASWRHWGRNRGYTARLQTSASGVSHGSYDDEYLLDATKTKVLGVHRAGIFKNTSEHDSRRSVYDNESQVSGPKLSPSQFARHKMLPGMAKYRASKESLARTGRLAEDDDG